MATQDEILELEQAISSFEAALCSNQIQLRKLETEYTRLLAKRDSAAARVKLQQGNQEHMRKVAELVNFEEMAEIARLVSLAETEVEAINHKMRVLDRNRRTVLNEIESNEKNLKRARESRSEYGQVIAFPKP